LIATYIDRQTHIDKCPIENIDGLFIISLPECNDNNNPPIIIITPEQVKKPFAFTLFNSVAQTVDNINITIYNILIYNQILFFGSKHLESESMTQQSLYVLDAK
jgi:hypothetical protein